MNALLRLFFVGSLILSSFAQAQGILPQPQNDGKSISYEFSNESRDEISQSERSVVSKLLHIAVEKGVSLQNIDIAIGMEVYRTGEGYIKLAPEYLKFSGRDNVAGVDNTLQRFEINYIKISVPNINGIAEELSAELTRDAMIEQSKSNREKQIESLKEMGRKYRKMISKEIRMLEKDGKLEEIK